MLPAHLLNYGYFVFVGAFGALVANATGAGGGIVFLPLFIHLGLSPLESLATSFAIQCFGMNSGALAWLHHRQQERATYAAQWQNFYGVLVVAIPSTLVGLLTAQYLLPEPRLNIEYLFAVFSLIVGGIILFNTLNTEKERVGRSTKLTRGEMALVGISCLLGGGITAWLSIGVGEILAILLIFLGFRVNVAVACAVCVTGLCILVAVTKYVFVYPAVSADVLVYAATGALFGGSLAKSFAVLLGAHRLKLFMSVWIILSALAVLF